MEIAFASEVRKDVKRADPESEGHLTGKYSNVSRPLLQFQQFSTFEALESDSFSAQFAQHTAIHNPMASPARSLTPTAPARGSFPLDHGGQCKMAKQVRETRPKQCYERKQ